MGNKTPSLPEVKVRIACDHLTGHLRMGCIVGENVPPALGDYIFVKARIAFGELVGGPSSWTSAGIHKIQADVDERVQALLFELLSNGHLRPPAYPPDKWIFFSPKTIISKPFKHLHDEPSAIGRPKPLTPGVYLPEMPPFLSSCPSRTSLAEAAEEMKGIPPPTTITEGMLDDTIKAMVKFGKSASGASKAFSIHTAMIPKNLAHILAHIMDNDH